MLPYFVLRLCEVEIMKKMNGNARKAEKKAARNGENMIGMIDTLAQGGN